jgi:L-alanine-DL-glutamate epimerase-like enolase superfamily enzyme
VKLEVSTGVLSLPFRDPFRIARADDDRAATTVIVEVRSDGRLGLGEAWPAAYYGETVATIEAVLPLLVSALEPLSEPPDRRQAALSWLADAETRMAVAIGGHGAAKAALDIALHDLVGQAVGLPIVELLGLAREIPPTDFSLGIDTPDAVAQRASRAAHFPALKIKVGGPADIATLEAVRAVYSGPLRVDANTGWSPDQGEAIVPELVRLGVELIEQPFPARQLPQLRWLQDRSPLPIVADESAVTVDDLDALDGVVDAVNVKLMKCGGIGPAVTMMRRARELGFKVMLGCMEETSVGIAAAAATASLADWVDLDGNLLLECDPFEGLELGSDCRWRLSEVPGSGIRRRPDRSLP